MADDARHKILLLYVGVLAHARVGHIDFHALFARREPIARRGLSESTPASFALAQNIAHREPWTRGPDLMCKAPDVPDSVRVWARNARESTLPGSVQTRNPRVTCAAPPRMWTYCLRH